MEFYQLYSECINESEEKLNKHCFTFQGMLGF